MFSRSSRKSHLTRQELDLIKGLGLSDLSCFLMILGIKLGFSNTRGGSKLGLARVYLLAASVFDFPKNSNGPYNLLIFSLINSKPIIQKSRIF